MRLLAMGPLHHPWQPAFARRQLGTALFVHEPGAVLGFKPGEPGSNGGAGPLQKATDTEFIPALILAFHAREPGLIAVGMRMLGPQLQWGLRGQRAGLPEACRGFVIETIRTLAAHKPC
jgi:hypothetical protein